MVSFVRRFAMRLVLMVGGEAMQSALHFVVNLWLLRLLSARDYGVFALVMVMGGLSLSYIRALVAMPASIWMGRSRGRGAINAYDVTFGSVALVLSAAIALIVGSILHSWLDSDALAGSVFVGLWALRSYLRTASFARAQPIPAAIGDGVFTATGFLLTLVLQLVSTENLLQWSFGMLSMANGLGIITILIAARRPIRFSLRRSVLRRYTQLWHLIGWSTLSITTINLQGQGMALVVAAMAGPAAYAPIAAMLVLFTPLRLIDTAVANMMQPDLALHAARHEQAALWRQAGIWTFIMGCGSAVYGAAIMLLLTKYDMRVFDGTSIGLLGCFVWAIYAASELRVMPRIILEVTGYLRRVAMISGASAIVGMTTVAAILTVAAPVWSLIGAVVSEVMVLVGFWFALIISMDNSRWKGAAGPVKWKLS